MRQIVSITILLSLLAICGEAEPSQIELRDTQASVIDSGAGVINGTIIDKDCGDGVAWANVVVLGTHLGAMTDSTGQFRIVNVPAGMYTVKAMGMGYSASQMESIQVTAARSARVDMALTGFLTQEVFADPSAVAPDCQVHKIPMEIVLVPIGIGLIISDPEYESMRSKKFPNAEPVAHGGCVFTPGMKTKSWEPRCRKCIAARNRYLDESDIVDNEVHAHKNWVPYSIGDVSFSVPKAAIVHVDTTRCSRSDRLDIGSMTIQTYFGPLNHMPSWNHHGRRRPNGQIISRVYATTSVHRAGNGGTVLGIFRVVPCGENTFEIFVSMESYKEFDQALAIVRSVRFREL
jgi:hypothetical protein